MKQIIKEGRKEKQQNQTFIMTCPSCGCVFTFTADDFEWIERTPNGRRGIACPFCEDEISIPADKLVVAEDKEIE